ncbi:ribonuclease H-like domain-containing protein [Rhodocollybia butyracea]|uniref:Ribonuclease H-like domain-containing protein n=1 Tax=Rhodocollybia butyracea TaxID=206335 RepID=A0A9P5TWB7_9AGAR|nr:ribonuclease H-like domain-containing protein [Rhodocollybia butyracea]
MARQKGEMWQFFWEGAKENSTHHRAFCLGCIRNQLGRAQLHQQTVVLGEKRAMIAHILGGDHSCRYASSTAIYKAKELEKKEQKGKRARNSDGVEEDTESTNDSRLAPLKKHKAVNRVLKQQAKLRVFKGISIPFTNKQEKEVHAQFLRATVSANLSYSWVSDPEVIKLFLMFCSCAGDVILSRDVLAGRLLKEEHARVEEELKLKLEGKKVTLTSGYFKNSLMGVNVSSEFKPYLVDLYNATADKKDGDSMEEALDKMIEKTEKRYKCTVVGLGTDNDGGTRSGRVKVVQRRPWLLTFPCGAHQVSGHLCVADYFKENPDAGETSEQATAFIGWLNNYGRVRSIFDTVQKEQTKEVNTYLVANATRWTTHLVAFLRLEALKQPLCTAAITRRNDIIAAQVGAEKNHKDAAALTASAEEQLDLIEDYDFWRQLTTVIEDLEPLAYATNICQSDKACPDCVLLAFVGLFLYFEDLPSSRFDQSLMITALILNPYEHLDRFGPDAGANIINVNAMVVELYTKVTSRPPSGELDPHERDAFESHQLQWSREFSAAFLQYCLYTGPFKNWKDLKANFQEIHGDDPIIFWESMKSDVKVLELADFSLLILHIIMNTAGNERQFSHVKIKKDWLRNRLLLEKLESSLKIGENLCAHHYTDGLRDVRKPRQNRSEDRVSKLLQVPRYGELVDGSDTSDRSALVTTQRHWRAELNQWKRDTETHDNGDPDVEEQLLMELLAQEKEGEPIPYDCELEGSGDEYNGN